MQQSTALKSTAPCCSLLLGLDRALGCCVHRRCCDVALTACLHPGPGSFCAAGCVISAARCPSPACVGQEQRQWPFSTAAVCHLTTSGGSGAGPARQPQRRLQWQQRRKRQRRRPRHSTATGGWPWRSSSSGRSSSRWISANQASAQHEPRADCCADGLSGRQHTERSAHFMGFQGRGILPQPPLPRQVRCCFGAGMGDGLLQTVQGRGLLAQPLLEA